MSDLHTVHSERRCDIPGFFRKGFALDGDHLARKGRSKELGILEQNGALAAEKRARVEGEEHMPASSFPRIE